MACRKPTTFNRSNRQLKKQFVIKDGCAREPANLSFVLFISKYVMFQDLESNQLDFAETSHCQAGCSKDRNSLRDYRRTCSRPELDENFPAERTAQVGRRLTPASSARLYAAVWTTIWSS